MASGQRPSPIAAFAVYLTAVLPLNRGRLLGDLRAGILADDVVDGQRYACAVAAGVVVDLSEGGRRHC